MVGCNHTVGGGTGLPSLLGGLKHNPWLHLNAVVTMFDSGGSSGQLRDELGKGALGRVFLATEPALGNRLVVLKLALEGGREAEILGQKQPADIDEPEFRPPMEPADDLAGPWVPDEHGKPPKIAVSGLAQIVGAKTIGNH